MYLCWRYKAVQPGKRRPACRPGFPRWTSELQSQRLGSRWGETTDPWSAQRSFHGTCGWRDLQRHSERQTIMLNCKTIIPNNIFLKKINCAWILKTLCSNYKHFNAFRAAGGCTEYCMKNYLNNLMKTFWAEGL